jgi:branched-chain amino acid transport system permease protein
METAWRLVLEGTTVGAMYALLALGLGLVFGVLNFVNLAHGEIVSVAVYVTVISFTPLDSYVLSGLVGFTVATVFGMVMYGGGLRLVARRSHFVQIVVTFAIVLLLQNAYLLTFGAESRSSQLGQTAVVELFGARILRARLIAGLVGVLLIVVVAALVQRTNFGRSMRAMASNPAGAEVTGVNPRRTGLWAFLVGSALAAAAGVLIAPFTPTEPHYGLDLTMRAFLIVIIASAGNTGGILATAIGVGIIEAVGVSYLPQSIATSVVYLAIIPVLLFRPRGLFARRTA